MAANTSYFKGFGRDSGRAGHQTRATPHLACVRGYTPTSSGSRGLFALAKCVPRASAAGVWGDDQGGVRAIAEGLDEQVYDADGVPPPPAPPPANCAGRGGQLRAGFDRVPRMRRRAPPPAPPPANCARRGEQLRAGVRQGASHAAGAPSPRPSPPLRRGEGEFERALAGPPHSTGSLPPRSLRGKGWGWGAAADAPGPASAHPSPEVYPLSHAVCGRGWTRVGAAGGGQSAKADFGPSLPRLQSPQQGRGRPRRDAEDTPFGGPRQSPA
jgi:hypothetical protein